MLRLLEVRIRVQEEHLRQLPLAEEVRQILHGVRPQTGDVLVLVLVLRTQSFDPVHDVVGNLHADFEPQGELVREEFSESDQEASVPAADVSEFHLVLADFRVEHRPIEVIWMSRAKRRQARVTKRADD